MPSKPTMKVLTSILCVIILGLVFCQRNKKIQDRLRHLEKKVAVEKLELIHVQEELELLVSRVNACCIASDVSEPTQSWSTVIPVSENMANKKMDIRTLLLLKKGFRDEKTRLRVKEKQFLEKFESLSANLTADFNSQMLDFQEFKMKQEFVMSNISKVVNDIEHRQNTAIAELNKEFHELLSNQNKTIFAIEEAVQELTLKQDMNISNIAQELYDMDLQQNKMRSDLNKEILERSLNHTRTMFEIEKEVDELKLKQAQTLSDTEQDIHELTVKQYKMLTLLEEKYEDDLKIAKDGRLKNTLLKAHKGIKDLVTGYTNQTCRWPWVVFNESCYLLMNKILTWYDAFVACPSGSHLLEIETAEEKHFSSQLVEDSFGAWIGALPTYGFADDFTWRKSGKALQFRVDKDYRSFWQITCLVISTANNLLSADCHERRQFICKTDKSG